MGKDSTRAVAKMSLDPADLTHDTVSWGFYKYHNFATEKTYATFHNKLLLDWILDSTRLFCHKRNCLFWFLFVRRASLRVNFNLLSRYLKAHTKQSTLSLDTPADAFSMRTAAPIKTSNLKTNLISKLKKNFDAGTAFKDNCLIIKISSNLIKSLNNGCLWPLLWQ